jgi:hypothetical protein
MAQLDGKELLLGSAVVPKLPHFLVLTSLDTFLFQEPRCFRKGSTKDRYKLYGWKDEMIRGFVGKEAAKQISLSITCFVFER